MQMECVMRVHLIETGTVRIKTAQIAAKRPAPLSLVDVFTDPNWSDWVPTYAAAIETDEGFIVVDTGQATHLLDEVKRSPHPFIRGNAAFRIESEQEIGTHLRALGFGPRDVTKVVLTHMHIDHDAGRMHFPQSKILAAPGEVANAKGVMGMLRGYLPQRWPGWFAPQALVLDDGAYGPFRASKGLTEDRRVIAVATPGHTPNHNTVIIEDDDAAIFMAGDTTYTEVALLAGQADGVRHAQAVTRQTLAAIRQL